MNTSVDNLIRDSLRTEARQPVQAAQPDRVLMQILQRAQTEVMQLPPVPPPEPETIREEPVIRQPRIALAHRETQPNVPRQSLAARIAKYREIVDMKIWCTIGPRAMRI
jgi:hypothetical protein